MRKTRIPSPLLLVLLVGLCLINCGEEQPAEPEAQPLTATVQTAKATSDEVEIPTLTATDLLQDPALEVFLGSLTIANDAAKIRRAMDAVVAALDSGDDAAAHDYFADARKAVASYGRRGELDPGDDVHLDVIDFFLDGVEGMLPDPGKGKKYRR